MFKLMVAPFERGYAVSSTDSGHVSTSSESQWAFHHPERIADWAWRAHHLTAIASKQIIAEYYGSQPKYSYFLGCSKGGGSSMMEVQKFPNDYDGIIAGAPGRFQSGQVTSYVSSEQAVLSPGGWLSADKLALLHATVLKECGGVLGYLEKPDQCRFDPVILQCKVNASADCLTLEQVRAVRRIYAGPEDEHGRPLYFGLARGSELQWSSQIMGPASNPGIGSNIFFSMRGYMENMILSARGWELYDFKPNEIMALSRSHLGEYSDAMQTDLSEFAAHGGKFIHFQGWNDPIVAPGASPDYYRQVVQSMGGRERVDKFYRLFMAPGMNHCAGGDGPNAVGGPFNERPPVEDAEHDMLIALEKWVENGKAPDSIIATKYEGNDPLKPVEVQRPWCPYPSAAEYRGRGDRKQASSYVCLLPRGKR